MEVYTFSTGGCRDGIYLDNLSTTKEGVETLINDYLLDTRDDLEFVNCEIGNKNIKVRVLDVVCNEYLYLSFELITFTVS